MNTKKNILFRETTEKFENALIELLNDYDLEHITVNMLCKKAGLHRSTFYAHYYNIYELMKIIGSRIKNELVERLNSAVADTFSIKMYVTILEEIRKNKSVYKLIIYSNYSRTIAKNIHDSIRTLLKEQKYDEDAIQYMLQFWTNGISAVLGKWLENDCKDDIEKVAEALHKCSKWIV